MRRSVNEPTSAVTVDGVSTSMSDAKAVDETPGVFSTLWSFILKIWWAFVIIAGLAAISFPYLFPDWAEKHKNALVELGIAANTAKFVQNAQSVDWKEAFSQVNIDNLMLVGTGRHPRFKSVPGLKSGTWYTGQVFMMKNYVREYDLLKWWEAIDTSQPAAGDFLLPATEAEQEEAENYCRSQNGRLPTFDELSLAAHFAFTKSWQGRTGKLLKSNLEFNIVSKYSLWTSTPEADGFTTRDNFRIYTHGKEDVRFEDDGFSSENLSFLCVLDEKQVSK